MGFVDKVTAVNAVALGWAVTLCAIAMNGIWGVHSGSSIFVWGVAAGVLTLATAYVNQIMALAEVAPRLRMTLFGIGAGLTLVSWLLWLGGALAHSA